MHVSFRDLHRPGDPFILANAWDAGSARMLAALGAEAIGTSSAAHAFTLGRPDMGSVTRQEALTHAQDIVAAVNIPVSGDFENGFGDDPDTVADTVRMAAEVGLAGISIEDTTLPSATPYDREHAVERIKAAASAARSLRKDFVLVARADGVMNGEYDLNEGIARLLDFDSAGADCLYLPMPAHTADLTIICKAIQKPVNALAAGRFTDLSRADFAGHGVARISIGSSLARVTHKVIHDAATAMFNDGCFDPLGQGLPGAAVDQLLIR